MHTGRSLPSLLQLESQCIQLGLTQLPSSSLPPHPEALRRSWERLERGDHTLLVTERLDESLLVLRAEYGLGFEDLVYRSFKVIQEPLPLADGSRRMAEEFRDGDDETSQESDDSSSSNAGKSDDDGRDDEVDADDDGHDDDDDEDDFDGVRRSSNTDLDENLKHLDRNSFANEPPDAHQLRAWLREQQPCDLRLWKLAVSQLDAKLSRLYPGGKGLQEDLERLRRVREMSQELCAAVEHRIGCPVTLFRRPVEPLPSGKETAMQREHWLNMLKNAGPARLGPWLRQADWQGPPVNALEKWLRMQVGCNS